jgi:molecular chaperone DnaK
MGSFDLTRLTPLGEADAARAAGSGFLGRIVGIDLGTTYSAVASVNDLGKPEILVNREGERITPSVVLFQGDLTQVGTQAKRSAPTAPDDVVQFVKRQMGNPDWRFTTSAGADFTAEQISAIILKRLKEDAEIVLGSPVTDAVITVPAYFDDARRKATQDAGTIAGLNVRRVLNEPTAAALSFGLDDDFEGTALVYDLGGGTFDVTIMRISPELLDVRSTKGDRNLGGFDWDNRLMGLLNDQVRAAGGPDLFDDELLTAELRDKAENAKRTLSSLEEARLFITADRRNFNLSVKRSDFEAASDDLLSMTEVILEEALEDAGLDWSGIDKILLVGGSTRMPMVGSLIQRLSGSSADRAINPDEAVALGAAIQGQLLAESEGSAQPVLTGSGSSLAIADVTSQSLGVVALDDDGIPANSVIIPHNTKIPVQHSGIYSTVVASQTELQVQITEGDDPDLAYVQIIHQEPLSIPAYPKGSPIEVIMSYDVDATIHVEVRDLTAQKTLGEIELDRPSNLEPGQVEEMANDMKELEVY